MGIVLFATHYLKYTFFRKPIMLDFESEDVADGTLLANPALVKLEADLVAFAYLAFQPVTLLAILGLALAAISVTSI